MVDSQTDHVLQWTNEFGGFELNLRVSSNYIQIETDAASQEDMADAMISAYRIIQEVSKIYGNQFGSFTTSSHLKQ